MGIKLQEKQYLGPAGSEILTRGENSTHRLIHSAKRNPKWEAELIPGGEQEAEMKAVSGKFWTLMNQHVCLYFVPETGRPLNVNSVQSVCLPHVPPVSTGKRKKESGILRSTSLQGNWSNAPFACCQTSTFHVVTAAWNEKH